MRTAPGGCEAAGARRSAGGRAARGRARRRAGRAGPGEPAVARAPAAGSGAHLGAAAPGAALPPRGHPLHGRPAEPPPNPVASARPQVRPPRAVLARLPAHHKGAPGRSGPPASALLPLPQLDDRRDRGLLEPLLRDLPRLRPRAPGAGVVADRLRRGHARGHERRAGRAAREQRPHPARPSVHLRRHGHADPAWSVAEARPRRRERGEQSRLRRPRELLRGPLRPAVHVDPHDLAARPHRDAGDGEGLA